MVAREWLELVAAAAFVAVILSAGQAATHAPRITSGATESFGGESRQHAIARVLCAELGPDSCGVPEPR